MGIFQGFIIFKLQLFYGLIVTLQDLAMDVDCCLLTIALSGQDLQSGANMLVKILPNQNLVSNVGIDSRYGANYLSKQPFFWSIHKPNQTDFKQNCFDFYAEDIFKLMLILTQSINTPQTGFPTGGKSWRKTFMFCYGGKTELRERSVIASRSEFLSSLRFVTFPNASLTQWLLNDHEKGGLGGGREKDLHISQISSLL